MELINVKASLGLRSSVPFAIDVFLPALPSGELPQPVEHRIDSADARSHPVVPEAALIEMAPLTTLFKTIRSLLVEKTPNLQCGQIDG